MGILAVTTLYGPTALLGGLGLLALAVANWRHAESITRSYFGDRRATWLARSPVGNRIGGTIFLVACGSMMIIGGFVQVVR